MWYIALKKVSGNEVAAKLLYSKIFGGKSKGYKLGK